MESICIYNFDLQILSDLLKPLWYARFHQTLGIYRMDRCLCLAFAGSSNGTCSKQLYIFDIAI